jgi:hypothetical protein
MNFLEHLLGAVQVGGTLVLSPLLRNWYNRWGATAEEAAQPMPGDELVPNSLLGYTHAITIQSPPARVWQWLAQMGQGRGGLYSYDGLENLAGCKIHSVDRIVPELQNLQVGELIRLGPQGYPCFAVAALEPGRALVLVSADPQTGEAVDLDPQAVKGFSIATWQFLLMPQDGNATRLLARQRLAYTQDMRWIWRLTEPVAFVMERKMLLGIRGRAERGE